jgi:light-independent protochlorophyllide reductase subunit N
MLLAPVAVSGDPWLPPRMPDASFLVVGSRSCAHLIYSASAVIIVTAARFDTAILGKSDLPGLTNNSYALEYLLSDLMKKQPAIHCLLLVYSYPARGTIWL